MIVVMVVMVVSVRWLHYEESIIIIMVGNTTIM